MNIIEFERPEYRYELYWVYGGGERGLIGEYKSYHRALEKKMRQEQDGIKVELYRVEMKREKL
jgi:hypothetical protein